MNIIVIGASKGIGREVVKTALARGYMVTAFARHPESLDIQHPKLRLQPGNVLEAVSVFQAIEGHDAVICTLGLPTLSAIGPPLTKRSYVLSHGTQNIIKAMTEVKVKRLICVTAIGAGDSASLCTPFARFILRRGLGWLFHEKDQQERLIEHSQLDWTIIRPTALTNGRAQDYLAGEHLRSGILTHVSRADVAALITKIVDQPESYRKALVVSYPRRLGDSMRWVAGYFGIL
jgi:putative NADH-flavin reductase